MGLGHLNQQIVDWLNWESEASGPPLSDFERIRYELKPCDVILLEGRSRVSNVIRQITSSPWTHAALYIGRLHDIEDRTLRETVAQFYPCEPDTQIIIESMLGQGTIATSLSNYEKDHLRICRPKGLSYKDSQQVVRYAISRLGAEYDVRQIFDLARFLFPWILLPRKWRSTLFQQHIGRSTRTVCSTMIAEAFGFIQFPILPLVKQSHQDGIQLFRRNPKLCVPRDFDHSPYFEIIKYPFIDFNLSADYRLLPWKGSGTLTGHEAELYLSSGQPFQMQEKEQQNRSTSPDETGGNTSEGLNDTGTSAANSEGQNKQNPAQEPEKEQEAILSQFPSNEEIIHQESGAEDHSSGDTNRESDRIEEHPSKEELESPDKEVNNNNSIGSPQSSNTDLTKTNSPNPSSKEPIDMSSRDNNRQENKNPDTDKTEMSRIFTDLFKRDRK